MHQINKIIIMEFKLKSGELNAYALACGYVEEKIIHETEVNFVEVQLYMEHSCYHVKRKLIELVEPYEGCLGVETNELVMFRDWKTYDNLTDARREYRRMNTITESNY